MTQTLLASDAFERFFAQFRRFGQIASKAGFGLFVIFAAGVALLATTFVGLMLAAAAVLLRLAHSFTRRSDSMNAKPEAQETRTMDQPTGDALEARQTPDGWVVENPSRN